MKDFSEERKRKDVFYTFNQLICPNEHIWESVSNKWTYHKLYCRLTLLLC